MTVFGKFTLSLRDVLLMAGILCVWAFVCARVFVCVCAPACVYSELAGQRMLNRTTVRRGKKAGGIENSVSFAS